ncbi:MAG TPA: hypothetical protein VF690_06870 [Hymenobacter sp.]
MQIPDNTALKIFSPPHYIGINTFDCTVCGGSGDTATGGICDAPGCESGQVPNPHYLPGCNAGIPDGPDQLDCLPGEVPNTGYTL